CLNYGSLLAWVVSALWLTSGIVFPTWLKLDPTTSDAMQAEHYVRFLVTQVLSGLLSASLSFFFVTFLNVRVFYPLLVQPEVDDTAAVQKLRGVARRASIFFGAAVAVPFLAMMTLALTMGMSTFVTEQKSSWGIAVVGAEGVFGSLLAYRLLKLI